MAKASTCSLIRIGKLTFASIVGMHLSSKRKDVLALSERPDQIASWMQWASFRVSIVTLCHSVTKRVLRALSQCSESKEILSNTVSGNTQPANAAGAGAAAAAVMSA